MGRLWFKSKLYGWGWYPATWQGWIILLVWIVLFISTLRTINDSSASSEVILAFVQIVLLVILLIFVCYGTGEKPRWRWGK